MSRYKDGEYEVEGVYGGSKSIIVKLELSGDVIKDVAVTPNTTIRMSLGLQKKFAAAVPDVVVGKSIDDVHLDKLAGSSKTTQGFNDAIEKIKVKAS
ncbi:MAG TPA: hypothetical protein VJ841_03850 [Candidatus Saccharimonadales bacterium]|nr:hypothetical protein [Candidatus Saccharimonadales bacterium]